MNKFILTLLLFTIVSMAFVPDCFAQTIPRELQNFKIEQYLQNPRFLRFQLNCVLYDGPCDRIGKYIKVAIPEIVKIDRCEQCTPKQNELTGKLFLFIQQNYAKEWDDAVKKFQGKLIITPSDLRYYEDLFKVDIRSKTLLVTGDDGSRFTTTASPPRYPTPSVSPKEIGELVRATITEFNSRPELRKQAEKEFKDLELKVRAKAKEQGV